MNDKIQTTKLTPQEFNDISTKKKTLNAIELNRIYNSVITNLHGMERSMLALMRHPDTTDAQIEDARARYVEVYKSVMNIRDLLRERAPMKQSVWTPPWNKPIHQEPNKS